MPSHILTEAEQMAAECVTEYVLAAGPSARPYYCRHCLSPMHLTTTPACEPVLSCDNPRCAWTVSAHLAVVNEVFSADSRLSHIVRLMATTGASYDLAVRALDDCCGGR